MSRLYCCVGLCVAAWAQVCAADLSTTALAEKYDALLLLSRSDFRTTPVAETVFEDVLLEQFETAVADAQRYAYELRGVPARYDFEALAGSETSTESESSRAANGRFLELFSSTLPLLAYAYRIPGPGRGDNPYFLDRDVLRLYAFVLEYCYSRGLTELAWMPDHAGQASLKAIRDGLVRPSGDFSSVGLRMGGFIQSIFLMREPLAQLGLLDKYRRVARNLVINNGVMYAAFFPYAREDAGTDYPQPLPDEQRYHLNADGVRIFVDYFLPFFLLIEDDREQQEMEETLRRVVAKNIAVKPGVQGTIKPDGTGFHHGTAYVGAYTPYAFESFAELLYLLEGTDFYRPINLQAVKLALQSFRTMVQKYTASSALRGRLIDDDGGDPAIAVTRAMALLAHPDGANDVEMQARFSEFFDPDYFFADERLGKYHAGRRGVPIRGLGIYRLIDEVSSLNVIPADAPSGAIIKPYAAAAFFRRNDWLVTAKGFSRYFWDYEGPLEKSQNSFGQNWSNGLLQVFSAGDPVSETGSGHDLLRGWDWYHVPGTTASHYPIEEREYADVLEFRRQAGIARRDIHRNYNTRSFVGGVTLGDHGFFVQDMEAVPFTSPTDLRARKSYFFVGDKVLALGTHVSGGTAAEATHTTVFQTRVGNGAHPGSIDGDTGGASNTATRSPAGTGIRLTDSAGNSYFLAGSTADLYFTRRRQRSLTPGYERTSATYVQAYLDHGIKPNGDRYEYVVIPSDADGSKLESLAADPSAYYRVVDSERMHLVHFPEWRVTAYAFYEPVETPADQMVRNVTVPAAVVAQQHGTTVQLAVSVPDMGWEYEHGELYRGLSYGSRQYSTQSAATHELTLILRGRWQVTGATEGISARLRGNETIVEISCSDGLSRVFTVEPAAAGG